MKCVGLQITPLTTTWASSALKSELYFSKEADCCSEIDFFSLNYKIHIDQIKFLQSWSHWSIWRSWWYELLHCFQIVQKSKKRSWLHILECFIFCVVQWVEQKGSEDTSYAMEPGYRLNFLIFHNGNHTKILAIVEKNYRIDWCQPFNDRILLCCLII